MSSTMAKVLFGPEGQLASGNVPPAATSFSGSITYPSSDGTITYNAQWSFQRM